MLAKMKLNPLFEGLGITRKACAGNFAKARSPFTLLNLVGLERLDYKPTSQDYVKIAERRRKSKNKIGSPTRVILCRSHHLSTPAPDVHPSSPEIIKYRRA